MSKDKFQEYEVVEIFDNKIKIGPYIFYLDEEEDPLDFILNEDEVDKIKRSLYINAEMSLAKENFCV